MAATAQAIERVAHRHLGASPAQVSDKRRAQRAPRQPILVHTCYDPATGSKPAKCECKTRVGLDEAIDWIKSGRAFWITVTRKNGKQILNRTSLVLSAEYAAIRERKFEEASTILQPLSLSGFEAYHSNFVERVETDLTQTKRSREIQAVRHMEIKQRRTENRMRKHRGGAEGYIKGSGGLTVGVYGEHKEGGKVGKGNGPDAWDRDNEDRKSKPDGDPAGARPWIPGVLNYGIMGEAGKALDDDDPRLLNNRRVDHRVLPHDLADAVSRKEAAEFKKEHDATIMS